jgi:uracil-DNA glycosylase
MIQFKSLISSLKTDWKGILLDIYKSREKHMIEMEKNIDDIYHKYDEYFETFPPPKLIFNAFNQFDFDDLRVVIIGQDPYHGEGQAMGLSFSVPRGVKVPPSLVNIYKELKLEYPEYEIPKHGDLTKWSKQGILLLNASLTVRQAQANSHESFWKNSKFTDDVIKYISDNGEGIIFMLWGNFAKKKKALINEKNHYILEGAHPSPLSAKHWFGNGHFKEVNKILRSDFEEEIDWSL